MLPVAGIPIALQLLEVALFFRMGVPEPTSLGLVLVFLVATVLRPRC
jgi:hypothetical protein